ncbi:MAG: hypothetical protein L3J05_02795 [Robiginitomaculum sp.]|nr:hypothetical protein [Robiginitomaculum sp.]
MSALSELKQKLRPGRVYRRSDLARWSKAVDRHVSKLVGEGVLIKASGGLYMTPSKSRFGAMSASPEKLVAKFLNDDRFLMVNPNAYNSLGVGTTQLYNEVVVYNRKRHEHCELGGLKYDFRRKMDFPKTVTPEFLLVDLFNNVKHLAENHEEVLHRAKARALDMDAIALRKAANKYGKIGTKKIIECFLA